MSNSLAQDIEAGDGTTSVVVIAGALLGAAERLFGSSVLLRSREGWSFLTIQKWGLYHVDLSLRNWDKQWKK